MVSGYLETSLVGRKVWEACLTWPPILYWVTVHSRPSSGLGSLFLEVAVFRVLRQRKWFKESGLWVILTKLVFTSGLSRQGFRLQQEMTSSSPYSLTLPCLPAHPSWCTMGRRGGPSQSICLPDGAPDTGTGTDLRSLVQCLMSNSHRRSSMPEVKLAPSFLQISRKQNT